MADFIQPFDPTITSSGYFNTSLQNGGWLIVHNESPIELQLSSGSTLAPFLVAAYTIRAKKIPLNVTRVNWLQAGNISGGGQAPISLVFAEACAPDEWTGGEIYLPLVRLTNVGNTIATSGSTKLVNDGNAPGTQVIETTPSDQATSSLSLNNDGSGFWQVLSANVLRKLINVVRGNASALKAVFTLGDSGDASILTVYGSIQGGQPANVGAITSTGANSFAGGTLTNDASGNLTAASYNGPAKIDVESNITVIRSQPTTNPVIIQANGHNTEFNADGSLSVAGALNVSGVVSAVGGVSTTGPTGVPVQIGGADDVSVTGATLTTIMTCTTPNDGKNHDYMVTADLFVGAGNTNNGTVTLEVAYQDPNQGALTLFYNVYGQNNLINSIAQAKGQGIRTDARFIRCKPNTSITVSYQNSAAGTKNDVSSAKAFLLG